MNFNVYPTKLTKQNPAEKDGITSDKDGVDFANLVFQAFIIYHGYFGIPVR